MQFPCGRRSALCVAAALILSVASAHAQQYIEGINDTLPVKPGWTASAGNEQAFLWTARNTFDLTQIQWHTSAIRSGTIRLREDNGGRPGRILREVPYASADTGWNGAPFDTAYPIVAGHTYFATMHGANEYTDFVADGGVRLTYYWTPNGREEWNGPFNGEPGQRMIKFFGFPGGDCEAIRKFKVKCRSGKLKAIVKSDLPEGSRLTIDNNGDPRSVAINRKGKGKAKWTRQTGRHEVVIVECPEFARTVDCR